MQDDDELRELAEAMSPETVQQLDALDAVKKEMAKLKKHTDVLLAYADELRAENHRLNTRAEHTHKLLCYTRDMWQLHQDRADGLDKLLVDGVPAPADIRHYLAAHRVASNEPLKRAVGAVVGNAPPASPSPYDASIRELADSASWYAATSLTDVPEDERIAFIVAKGAEADALSRIIRSDNEAAQAGRDLVAMAEALDAIADLLGELDPSDPPPASWVHSIVARHVARARRVEVERGDLRNMLVAARGIVPHEWVVDETQPLDKRRLWRCACGASSNAPTHPLFDTSCTRDTP